MTCTVEGCSKKARYTTTGYCSAHYNRWRRYGDPTAGLPRHDDGPRLPFAPLERHAQLGADAPLSDGGPGVTVEDIATRLGVTARSVHRYRAEGLSLDAADRLATANGLHPCHLWPEWWEYAA